MANICRAGSAALGFAALAVSEASAADNTFTDQRDHQTYPTVEIAGAVWMAKNLNFATNDSYCLYDDAKNCAEYGRLYPWEVALGACPAGWHLASEYEWRELELHFGVEAEELEMTRHRGADTGIGRKLVVAGGSGLEVKYSGWRRPDGTYTTSNGEDRAAALWTSTDASLDDAWHRDISSARAGSYRSLVSKPYALAVRCVKNARLP